MGPGGEGPSRSTPVSPAMVLVSVVTGLRSLLFPVPDLCCFRSPKQAPDLCCFRFLDFVVPGPGVCCFWSLVSAVHGPRPLFSRSPVCCSRSPVCFFFGAH